MKREIVMVVAGAVIAALATTVSSAEPTQVERVQAAIRSEERRVGKECA